MKKGFCFFMCLSLTWFGLMPCMRAQTATMAEETYPVSLYGLTTAETAPAHPAEGWTEFPMPVLSDNERDTLTKAYLNVGAAPENIEKTDENFMALTTKVSFNTIGFDFPYGGRSMTHFGLTGNGLIYLSNQEEGNIKYESSLFSLSDIIVAKPMADNQGYGSPAEPHFVADVQTKIGYYQDPDGDYLIIGFRDMLVGFTLFGQPWATPPVPDKDYHLRVTYDLILFKDGRILLRPVDMKPQMSEAGSPLLYFAYGLFGASGEAVAAADWTGMANVVEDGYSLNTMAVTEETEKTVLTYTLPVPCHKPENVKVEADITECFSTDFKAVLRAEGSYDGLLAFVADKEQVSERPENGKAYSTGNWMSGPDEIGGYPVKISGMATGLSADGLAPASTCHIYVYPYNAQCLGGPVYAETPVIIPVQLAVGGPAVEVAETTGTAVKFTFPGLKPETGILVGVARRDYRNETPMSRYEIEGISGKRRVGDTLFYACPAPEDSPYSNQGPYLIQTAYAGAVENASLTIDNLEPATPYYFYFWMALDGEDYSKEYIEKGVYTLAETPHTFTFTTDRTPVQGEEGWLPAGWSSSDGMDVEFSAAMWQVGYGMAEGSPDERRALGARLTPSDMSAAFVRADVITPAFRATHAALDVRYRVGMQSSSMMGSTLSQLGSEDTLSVWYRVAGQAEWQLASCVTSEDGAWEYTGNFTTLKATVRNVPTDKAIHLRFMIRATPGGGMMSSKIFTLHHVLVEPHLNCAYPENIAVVDTLMTHRNIGLNWEDDNVPAASVIYRYRAVGTEHWSAPYASTQPTLTEIRRLQPHTDYEIALQAVCRRDSSLVKTIQVQTLYGLPYQTAVTDLTEMPAGFSGYVGELPETGTAEISKDMYGQGFNVGKYSEDGHTAIGTSFETMESFKWLMLPVVSLEDMTAPAEYTFRYKAYYDNMETGAKEAVDPESPFRVLVLVSKTGQFSREDSVGVLTVAGMKTDYQTYTIDLSNYTRQVHVALYTENPDMAFENQMRRMSSYFVIDSLEARYTAEIPCYAVEDVNQYGLTTDGITISWVGYSEEYGIILTNEDKNETDTIYTKEMTYTLTGLEPATLYTYRIQGYCEEGHRSPSALSEEGFFTTRARCATPTDFAVVGTTAETVTLTARSESNRIIHIWGKEEQSAGLEHFVDWTAETDTTTVEGLQKAVTYYVALRGVCAAGDSSAWIEPLEFTTEGVAIERTSRFADLKVGADHGRIAVWNAGALPIDRVEVYGLNGRMLYGNDFRTDGHILLPALDGGARMALVRVFSAGETAVYKIVLL